MHTVILRDPHAMAQHAASLVEAEAATSERLLLGLSGGSTPRRLHEELAARAIDWDRVTAWISDERWVPPDSADSNTRMARETLVDQVGVRLLAPDTTLKNPTVAAREYADVVVPEITGRDRRSIVFLGLGTDGHTASLFPGTTALEADGASYVATFVPQIDSWRLTATYDLIALADLVVFLVAGAGKADVVREIADGVDHPATAVTARERVMWLLDEAAASKLVR